MLLAAYSKGKRSCVEQSAHRDACGSNFGNLWSGLGGIVFRSGPPNVSGCGGRLVTQKPCVTREKKSNHDGVFRIHCMMFLFVPFNPLHAELVSHSL